jgi:cytochrome c oxidase cbb3-type subunit III
VKDLKSKKLKDDIRTTGHEWDGIEELDTPDPFWLRLLFYTTLFFSLGYWLLYPSFPSQREYGVLKWAEYKELEDSLNEVKKIKEQYQNELDKASFDQILHNPELLKFALRGGRSAFLNNCAVCHGNGGNGNIGYPNLTAGAWLWGGKLEDIYQTLKYGIRSGHEEARDSQMAAFGRDGILTKDQILLLVDFVRGLYKGGNYSDEANKLYLVNCASCHGDKGQGDYRFGTPALNDAIWLYKNDRDSVYDVIYNGRQGVMPYWINRLDDSVIRQLTIYVHQLGGGQ